MAQKIVGPFPPDLDLGEGSTLRVLGVDPTTGATVLNITVTNVAIEVRDATSGGTPRLDFGPFMLVPGPGA